MMQQGARENFREAVGRYADQWLADGLPSRQVLDTVAAELLDRRRRTDGAGIHRRPATLLTATLDDALGQGLAVIERYATAIGMQVIPLGLMQTPQAVVDACQKHRPDYLGLTILQFDTEDDLRFIAAHLPAETRIVAGGPVFTGDPAFAARTGTHIAARNVAHFLRIMLAENR